MNEADAVVDREARATHALEAYRERRRRRRAEDTWFGSASCLADPGAGADDGAAQRRDELLGDAVGDGMSQDLAEQLYDIAREEGVDPVLAMELVRCGLGVAPPDEGVSSAPEQPTSDKYAPGWVLQPPSAPDDVLRERMLRLSFRRLRALLEAHPEPADAMRAFAREPDVGVFGY